MIKFKNSSIWYYLKRPRFAYSQLYSDQSTRIYSLFIMDMIEQDLIELVAEPSYSSYSSSWKLKFSGERIRHNVLNSYIKKLLNKKERQFIENTDVDKIKSLIKLHLTQIEKGSTK